MKGHPTREPARLRSPVLRARLRTRPTTRPRACLGASAAEARSRPGALRHGPARSVWAPTCGPRPARRAQRRPIMGRLRSRRRLDRAARSLLRLGAMAPHPQTDHTPRPPPVCRADSGRARRLDDDHALRDAVLGRPLRQGLRRTRRRARDLLLDRTELRDYRLGRESLACACSTARSATDTMTTDPQWRARSVSGHTRPGEWDLLPACSTRSSRRRWRAFDVSLVDPSHPLIHNCLPVLNPAQAVLYSS